MFKKAQAFSSFSTNDLDAAKEFYGEILGIDVREQKDMGIMLVFVGGGKVFIYPKEDHQPASFTVLNLPVDDIEKAVDELEEKGVKFEQYDLGFAKTNEKGIAQSKNDKNLSLAWFKDPAGNVLSIIQSDM